MALDRAYAKRVGVLAALLFMVALTTSRVTLVAHEFVGHGGVALAVGSTIDGFELFLFAGGHISSVRDTPLTQAESLSIALGGIAVQLLLGIVALALTRWCRRGSIAHIALLAYGGVVIIHGLFYLSAGTFHGYGDGWGLNRALGADRVYLCVPIAAAVVAITYAATARLVGVLRSRLPGDSRGAQLGAILVAGALAGGGHAALSFGELALRPDPVYQEVMAHRYEHDVQAALNAYLARQQARGVAVSERDKREKRRALVEKYKPFPFNLTLGVLVGIAFFAGAIRSRAHGDIDADPIALGDLRWVAATLSAALAVVATIKWLG